MEEQESLNSENVQVAPEETANHAPEQETQTNDLVEKVDNQERNWREMRRQKADLERKLQMQDEMLERLMKAQPAPQPVQEVDELDQIDDSEVLQKGHTKKMIQKEAQKIAKQIVKDELSDMMQKQHQATYAQRLKSQFSDFEEVVNSESLALLEEQEPELAHTIAEHKDPYKVLLQSYKFIKKLGIDKDVSNVRHSKEVEKKIEKNAKTVQSPQAHDKRPMAQAFKMTSSMRDELAKEMQYYARQASSVPEMG